MSLHRTNETRVELCFFYVPNFFELSSVKFVISHVCWVAVNLPLSNGVIVRY